MGFGTKGCEYNCGDACDGSCLPDESKPTVRYIGKHLIFIVTYNDIEYEVITSEDTKDLFDIYPEPESRVEIEDIIRDAAWNLEIENFD